MYVQSIRLNQVRFSAHIRSSLINALPGLDPQVLFQFAVNPLLGVSPRNISVVLSGIIADELLLEFAIENGLRVVTNDRFLDWRVQYPRAAEKGFLVKGSWREGTAMFRGFKCLVRVDKTPLYACFKVL